MPRRLYAVRHKDGAAPYGCRALIDTELRHFGAFAPHSGRALAKHGTAAGGCGIYRKEVSPVKGVKSAEAVIDNGEFGVRKIRFETGRLARQASGSALVVLDEETVVLSATSASKQPREGLDFFPLTVDVEESMYAA